MIHRLTLTSYRPLSAAPAASRPGHESEPCAGFFPESCPACDDDLCFDEDLRWKLISDT